MKKLIINLSKPLMLIALIIGSNSLSAQESAVEIIRKMEDRMQGSSSYIEMTMTTVRPRYTREVSMKSWSKGDDFALILITAPARDKGTAYLKRGNEIWNYVPNIDRMIKLPPSMMSQSWMGSDFSNDDLVRESSNITDYNHRILRSERYEGRDCWVIELIPRPESSIVFGKIIMWIAKDIYVQMKIENYDEDDVLVSTLYFKNIKNMGGRTIPTRIEMLPHDRRGQKTILEYKTAQFDISIEDSFFSVQNLKNVR